MKTETNKQQKSRNYSYKTNSIPDLGGGYGVPTVRYFGRMDRLHNLFYKPYMPPMLKRSPL